MSQFFRVTLVVEAKDDFDIDDIYVSLEDKVVGGNRVAEVEYVEEAEDHGLVKDEDDEYSFKTE